MSLVQASTSPTGGTRASSDLAGRKNLLHHQIKSHQKAANSPGPPTENRVKNAGRRFLVAKLPQESGKKGVKYLVTLQKSRFGDESEDILGPTKR